MPSIEKRGRNSWRLVVEGGYDATGKRIQHRRTIKIEDESILRSKRRLQDYLQMELTRFRQEVESGQYIKPERITFADFIPTWKKNYADIHLGAYTRKNYMAIVNARLLPALGHLELGKIKTMHLVAFMTELKTKRKDGRDKPLATNTLLNVYKTLKSIFNTAEKWQLIAKNPMEGVDRPVADKAERRDLKTRKRAYSLEESLALIEALQDEPEHWRLYFLGVLLGGFRRGEMLALQWPHVDFTAGGVHVEKQISMTEDGKKVEAELKTEESAAFVPMPRWWMDEMAKYRQTWRKERMQLGPEWKGGDKQYVFHNGRGEPFYPTVPTYRWRKFLQRHDLPHIRLHDLRHTTATLLREDGADLKAIQERLRHARLSTTADLYTHASELVSRETADRLEKLNPSKAKSQARSR